MKQFHAFRLDPINHRLWRGDERVTLTPKAFDVLRFLVQHADRLVTQEETLEAVWPETHVNPEVVKKYVLEVRKALGDRSDRPTFIETFPKRGYQFVAPVLEASSDTPSSLPARAATMVGRDAPRALLEACLEQARRGHRQVIFVTGEAGVGKTTLVEAFQRRAAERASLRIACGQCVEGFGGKEPYYPILEALGHLLRETERNRAVAALVRCAPTWLVQFPSLVKRETREALHRETIGTTRERMVREICEALEAITAADPLVLALEDLHWVDLSTLDVISALARRRGPAKLVVLCTYRPGDVVVAENPLKVLKEDLLVHRLCTELALEHLGDSDVADYLLAEFPRADFPPGLAGLIHRYSGGNALFMTAIVRDMVDHDVIVEERGRRALSRPLTAVAPAVPATLQQMLEAQFILLSAAEQRILSHASVAGDRFSVWVLTTEPDLTPDEIENACERLAERQQFLRAAGFQELANGTVSAHYEFRHALYREAVYRRLSDVSRSRLHRLVGERLEVLCRPGQQELAAEIALHFENGRHYDRAIGYLILAAENAAVRFAYRDSIQVLQHALALVPRVAVESQADLEIQLLERIGDAHYWLGAMVECARAYEAEAARAARGGLTAARVNALSFLVRPFGRIDPDRGIAAIEEAVALSANLGDPLLHGRTELLAAGSRLLYDTWRQDDWDICESARRTLQGLSPAGVPEYHRMIYAHLQMLQGHYAEALANLEAGIPKMNEPTSLMVHIFSLSGKTVALLHSGQLGELMRIVRSGREMAEKNGRWPRKTGTHGFSYSVRPGSARSSWTSMGPGDSATPSPIPRRRICRASHRRSPGSPPGTPSSSEDTTTTRRDTSSRSWTRPSPPSSSCTGSGGCTRCSGSPTSGSPPAASAGLAATPTASSPRPCRPPNPTCTRSAGTHRRGSRWREGLARRRPRYRAWPGRPRAIRRSHGGVASPRHALGAVPALEERGRGGGSSRTSRARHPEPGELLRA